MSSETETMNETNANNNCNEENNNENNNGNDEENNREDNEDTGASDPDIFSLLYGDDQNQNDGSDEEIDCDHNDYSNNDDEEEDNESQQIQSNNNSKKRQSTDENSSPAKRVKSEPMSPKRVSNDNNDNTEPKRVKRLTTTCEPILEIPKTSQEFMKHILEWDPNCLESNNDNQIPMTNNLKDVTNLLNFDDFNTFCDAFIPSIIVNLWDKVKRAYSLKHKNRSKANEKTRFLSILTKTKSKRMKDGFEMKCISLTKANESPVFKFGQLVLIRTAVQTRPNSNAHMITRKSHFGYVCTHVIRDCNQQNQCEVNHLRLLSEEKRDSIIIEEVIFLTKFSDELFLRNDALIVAEPILCIHNYHLQARAVFKFQEFPLWRQIFNPIFNSKASGILVDKMDKHFDNNQLECIQVALDVIASSSLANSCFLAINDSQSSRKTSLLLQIIKQISGCDQLKTTKILFTSSNAKCLNNVYELLKRCRINTFLIENDFNPTLIRSVIKHIEHRLKKDVVINDLNKKKLYEECLEYFESNMDYELSVESTLFKNNICEQVRHDLMNLSTVIIGSIDHLCNDIAFYKIFSSRDAFSCCIIDDSIGINEPQLYSLFWFGVKKFVLASNIHDNFNSDDSEICQRMGLSRSFFRRYYLLSQQNYNNMTKTVFNL